MKSAATNPARSVRQPRHAAASAATATEALADAAAVGAELAASLRKLVDALPSGSDGPSALAAELGASRVLVSRTLGAIAGEDPLDTLQRVPGPETLRGIVEAAAATGAPATRIAAAVRAIERFGSLIRNSYGTRGALNAAICANAPAMQRRLELESRQRVFKGMRELRGVEAETWLSASIVVRDRDDPTKLSVVMLQGFLALRRLRLDVPVAFAFESVGGVGHVRGPAVDVPTSAVSLEDLYTHVPAPLVLDELGGQRLYRLAQDRIGKDAVSDMLALTQMRAWRPRWSRPDRPLTGAFAQPQTPVKTMVLDILVDTGITTEDEPELYAYAPSVRGGANVNDRSRDFDRVAVPERIERIDPPGNAAGRSRDRFELPDVPNYRQMLTRVAGLVGADIDAMRLLRVRIPYPPFGYQFVSTFRLPDAPPGQEST